MYVLFSGVVEAEGEDGKKQEDDQARSRSLSSTLVRHFKTFTNTHLSHHITGVNLKPLNPGLLFGAM